MPVGSRKSTVTWSRAWPARGSQISRWPVMAGGMAGDTPHYSKHRDLRAVTKKRGVVQTEFGVFPMTAAEGLVCNTRITVTQTSIKCPQRKQKTSYALKNIYICLEHYV